MKNKDFSLTGIFFNFCTGCTNLEHTTLVLASKALKIVVPITESRKKLNLSSLMAVGTLAVRRREVFIENFL